MWDDRDEVKEWGRDACPLTKEWGDACPKTREWRHDEKVIWGVAYPLKVKEGANQGADAFQPIKGEQEGGRGVPL